MLNACWTPFALRSIGEIVSTRCALVRGMLVSLVGLASLQANESDPVLFRRWEINSASEFSACAAVDVDHDGRLDIYCGDRWYQAPSWKPHKTRDVPLIRGRYDDYSNLPLDVDGDGWTDIISVNYRSKTLYWVQHPGSNAGEWQSHKIDSPGPSETGRLEDIDGDGVVDLLPNGADFAAWYELVRPARGQVAGAVHWTRHDLPRELVGHGLGFGDVDGDGRDDLVSAADGCRPPLTDGGTVGRGTTIFVCIEMPASPSSCMMWTRMGTTT